MQSRTAGCAQVNQTAANVAARALSTSWLPWITTKQRTHRAIWAAVRLLVGDVKEVCFVSVAAAEGLTYPEGPPFQRIPHAAQSTVLQDERHLASGRSQKVRSDGIRSVIDQILI